MSRRFVTPKNTLTSPQGPTIMPMLIINSDLHPPIPGREYITIGEAARLSRCHHTVIRRLIRRRALVGYRGPTGALVAKDRLTSVQAIIGVPLHSCLSQYHEQRLDERDILELEQTTPGVSYLSVQEGPQSQDSCRLAR